MKLSDHQAHFLKDVATLIATAPADWKITGGELYRNPALQKYYVEAGLSWTLNSRHASRLAIDLNLFTGGEWVGDSYDGGEYQSGTESYRPLGKVWEDLSPFNVWAVRLRKGTLTDGNHFERLTTPREAGQGNSLYRIPAPVMV